MEKQDLKSIPPAVDHASDEMLNLLSCSDEQMHKYLSEAVGYAQQVLENWMNSHVLKVVDAVMLEGDRASKIFLWMLMLYCTWREGHTYLYTKIKHNSPMERIDPWLESFDSQMDMFCKGAVKGDSKQLVHPDLYAFVAHLHVYYQSS